LPSVNGRKIAPVSWLSRGDFYDGLGRCYFLISVGLEASEVYEEAKLASSFRITTWAVRLDLSAITCASLMVVGLMHRPDNALNALELMQLGYWTFLMVLAQWG
jgi:hypothetical protein